MCCNEGGFDAYKEHGKAEAKYSVMIATWVGRGRLG